ncbi:hypothetical protein ACJZ2D_012328 [Fusarium nematophilum]
MEISSSQINMIPIRNVMPNIGAPVRTHEQRFDRASSFLATRVVDAAKETLDNVSQIVHPPIQSGLKVGQAIDDAAQR